MALLKKTVNKPPGTGSDAVVQADSLLQRPQAVHDEETALLESSSLESRYSAALTILIEEKYDQVKRLDERLEQLIEVQASRLQQTPQVNPPGRIALPGTRARWRDQVQQQSVMQRLHDRLEMVREIREGMGLYGPRIEELAARKLRAADPALAMEWEEMCQTRRLHQAHQALLEKKEPQRKRRGLRLDLTQGE